jgi:PPOX class probable F420-dependent enzyme
MPAGYPGADGARPTGQAGGVARTLAGDVSDEFRAFWTERHLASLVTLRADGTPHVVPVGVTLDLEPLEAGTGPALARVICRGGSVKARNAAARGIAVVSQVDGARWSTLEGDAVVRADRAAVAEAERRYALRYRVPRPNPERVVVEIAVRRVLGPV